MDYVISVAPIPAVPVIGQTALFPVRRIYCVARNYEEHAREMGFDEREPPFFFMKPGDAALPVAAGQTGAMHYPGQTDNLHHEVELVVAVGRGGRDISVSAAQQHVFGYAVGLDMTRRDLQLAMRDQGRPWDIAKGFDESAPIGPIVPIAQCGALEQGRIQLEVNGQRRQDSDLAKMIWKTHEIIARLSQAWALQAGDLIFTGTPHGVGPVVRGDEMLARIDGLGELRVRVV